MHRNNRTLFAYVETRRVRFAYVETCRVRFAYVGKRRVRFVYVGMCRVRFAYVGTRRVRFAYVGTCRVRFVLYSPFKGAAAYISVADSTLQQRWIDEDSYSWLLFQTSSTPSATPVQVRVQRFQT